MRTGTKVSLLSGLMALVAVGCSPPRLDAEVSRHSIEVRLEPTANSLAARSTIELAIPSAQTGSARIDLQLNRGLDVEELVVDGATLRSWRLTEISETERGAEEEAPPAKLRIELEDPGEAIVVHIVYSGSLWQDVESGEDDEEIHNLTVSAHVSPEGIYLEPSGYWYPTLTQPDEIDPARSLAHYTLKVEPIPGFELVAGAEREPGEALAWNSPFPLEGLVLLGGPLERHSREHNGVALHAVLAPGKAKIAEDILDASAEYLDRYVPLIGPYPFREFTVLEAFFSSGFAFPTCTQIDGVLLNERRQYRRHGYLDHELLHAWWGNGIYVDPRDGNWCEGLASYGGNLTGHVLDGDAAEARKTRRNFSHFLSRIEDENNKPLGTFGIEDGAGGGIGYSKGAMVWHMLDRKIGSEAFTAGLRRLTAEQVGRHASWETIRQAMEAESGENLETYFDQWVRRNGAPELSLLAASVQGDSLQVEVTQGETAFELDVPLRIHYENRFEDVVVPLSATQATVSVPIERDPVAVELDPDYHLFRKLKPEETMPTSSLTHGDEELIVVVPEGELSEGYATVRDSFVRGTEEKEGKVTEIAMADLESGDLAAGSVLILGDAARHPLVAELLGRTRSPVVWTSEGFAVGERSFRQELEAIYFTVHHPDAADRGVTVYYGNSAASLSNAGVLNFYPNSLLVFESPAEGPDADPNGMPRAKVVERIDFEFHDRIDLRSEPEATMP